MERSTHTPEKTTTLQDFILLDTSVSDQWKERKEYLSSEILDLNILFCGQSLTQIICTKQKPVTLATDPWHWPTAWQHQLHWIVNASSSQFWLPTSSFPLPTNPAIFESVAWHLIYYLYNAKSDSFIFLLKNYCATPCSWNNLQKISSVFGLWSTSKNSPLYKFTLSELFRKCFLSLILRLQTANFCCKYQYLKFK